MRDYCLARVIDIYFFFFFWSNLLLPHRRSKVDCSNIDFELSQFSDPLISQRKAVCRVASSRMARRPEAWNLWFSGATTFSRKNNIFLRRERVSGDREKERKQLSLFLFTCQPTACRSNGGTESASASPRRIFPRHFHAPNIMAGGNTAPRT